MINNQTTGPSTLPIDVQVVDTCASAATTHLRALELVNQTRRTAVIGAFLFFSSPSSAQFSVCFLGFNLVPLRAGVIALEEPDVLLEAASVLRRHGVPLVVATPKASEALFYADQSDQSDVSVDAPSNVFSAVPNSASIARVGPASLTIARLRAVALILDPRCRCGCRRRWPWPGASAAPRCGC